MLRPDIGLVIWQLSLIVSWALSVLIVIRGAQRKDSLLLLFGAISFLIPLLMTVPYFVFAKK